METNNIDLLRQMTDMMVQKEHENNELKTALLDLIGGVSIIDLEGRYVVINDRYASTCGYTPKELVGVEWSITVHPEDLGIAMKCYEDMLKNNKSELVFRGVKKNGDIFTKEIILISRFSVNGDLIGHYCFMKERS